MFISSFGQVSELRLLKYFGLPLITHCKVYAHHVNQKNNHKSHILTASCQQPLIQSREEQPEHCTASEMSACLLIPMETTPFYSNWALAIASVLNRFCLQAQRIVKTKQESGSKVCSRIHPLNRLESSTSFSIKSGPFFYEISFPFRFQFTKGLVLFLLAK